MDEIFEMYGEALLSAVAACMVISLAAWSVFGDPTQNGTLSKFIYDALNLILQ